MKFLSTRTHGVLDFVTAGASWRCPAPSAGAIASPGC